MGSRFNTGSASHGVARGVPTRLSACQMSSDTPSQPPSPSPEDAQPADYRRVFKVCSTPPTPCASSHHLFAGLDPLKIRQVSPLPQPVSNTSLSLRSPCAAASKASLECM